MVGIISNTAALNAQSNLNKASLDSQSSISRLSSGNRISRAADDVAGLAVGTILKTNVSTLKAALNNTAQANSLLGVADGSLKNIGDILQRQKVLASQATSGSLTDSARSFLNQEFQNLKLQIDQISDSTNFNGIKLVDGSLYSPADLTSETSKTATQTSGVVTIGGTSDVAFANGNTFTIICGPTSADCVTFTWRTANAASVATDIDLGAVNGFAAGAAGTTDASNVMVAIQNVLNSTSTVAAILTAKNTLSALNITQSGQNLTITSKAAGMVYNNTTAAYVPGSLSVGASGITLAAINGTNIAGAVEGINRNGGTLAVGNDVTAASLKDGYLSAGSFSTTAGVAYAGTASTIAVGTITDTLLNALAVGANTTGANFSGVSNNEAFIGTISGFEATYSSLGYADVSVTVGDYTYLAKNVLTNPTTGAGTSYRFASVEAGGGFFDLQFDDSTASGAIAITNQDDADSFAARIDQALSGVQVVQQRQVESYNPVGSVYNSAGTAIGNLTGTNFNLFADDFSNLKIEDISITAGAITGAVQPIIEVTINGEVFRSGFTETGATTATPFTIGATDITLVASTSSTTGMIGLRSTTNPNNLLVFRNHGATALNFTTADNCTSIENAFKAALGVDTGGSALTFQIGTTSSDTIGVQVESAATADIYQDSTGVTQTLDISTQAGAVAAGDILDNAINTVTAIRANIGALQSRFDYAAANIESGIQNQDAARSNFLDTDIAAESTAFASSQVRLQASISVLAQANQLPQNLLKLIG